MSNVEEIQNRLLQGSAKSKAYAAMAMRSHSFYDEPLIHLLTAALEQVAAKADDCSKDELGFISHGIVALSCYIQETAIAGASQHAGLALVKLACSSCEQISGTAIFWLGELKEKGQFAIDAVLSQKIQEPVRTPYPSGVTLRATAYRSIVKINPEFAMSLGDIPAREELRRALSFWIAESQLSTSREKLQKELNELETNSS